MKTNSWNLKIVFFVIAVSYFIFDIYIYSGIFCFQGSVFRYQPLIFHGSNVMMGFWEAETVLDWGYLPKCDPEVGQVQELYNQLPRMVVRQM